MLRSAVLVLVVVALSGCSAYPDFKGRVVNDTTEDQEVCIEVLRGTEPVLDEDNTVAAGDTWDLGTFTRDDGNYTIRFHVAGRLAVDDTRRFDHDGGPGGFVAHLARDGSAEITYWNT